MARTCVAWSAESPSTCALSTSTATGLRAKRGRGAESCACEGDASASRAVASGRRSAADLFIIDSRNGCEQTRYEGDTPPPSTVIDAERISSHPHYCCQDWLFIPQDVIPSGAPLH